MYRVVASARRRYSRFLVTRYEEIIWLMNQALLTGWYTATLLILICTTPWLFTVPHVVAVKGTTAVPMYGDPRAVFMV